MHATHAYAMEGARRALARVAAATDAHALSHAAAEAAMWVAALDEKLGGKVDASPYVEACRADEVRDLLQGIRYVRNQATHALARLAFDNGRIPFALPMPLSAPRLVWEGKQAPEGHSPAQRRAYMSALAGRGVIDTLRTAIDWLSQHLAFDEDRT